MDGREYRQDLNHLLSVAKHWVDSQPTDMNTDGPLCAIHKNWGWVCINIKVDKVSVKRFISECFRERFEIVVWRMYVWMPYTCIA